MIEDHDYTKIPVTILIAEDNREMLELLEKALQDEGYWVVGVMSGEKAVATLGSTQVDIVLTDLRMAGFSGLDVLRATRSRYPHQPVILMTAFGSIETAVEAMREGAYSYITKPFDLDELLSLVSECAEQIRLMKEVESFPSRHEKKNPLPIVFRNPAFRSVLQLVHVVSKSNTTVLITGESGTGKEVLAREIHRQSARKEKPLVALDANAIPENLLENEMFGHARGAFTGADKDKPGIIEMAEGSTLFLDEIGNLNPAAQAKLLRFLQDRRFRRVGDSRERSVDARLITATNRDLKKLIAEGGFREDLYYRISVVQIQVPPLRERREDIALLLYHFLRRFNTNQYVEGFRPEVLDLLIDYDWPGNVRQLENAVEHAVLLRKKGYIQKSDLPAWISSQKDMSPKNLQSLEEMERRHILQILEECDGNRSRAARQLGIHRRTLIRKLKQYGQQRGVLG